MTTYTPGPWGVGLQAGLPVVVSGSRKVADLIIDEGIGSLRNGQLRDEIAANARLIAAAPELLAACRAFVEAWEKCHQLEKTDVALRMAKDAIERAEGRS